MNARLFLTPLLILMTSLASCADKSQEPVGAVESVLSKGTPAARKAEVIRIIRAACPNRLTDDEAEWVAQFVEGNRSAGAIYVAGLLWKMNAETIKCRGAK
jgi:type IV pilus biogenesis protein CpaD/CtpE